MAVGPGVSPLAVSRRELRSATGLAGPARREDWADSARGLCILLVVLGHAAGMYGVLSADIPTWVSNVWNTIVMAFKPIRVPLFFLISGYFAHRAIQRPWRHSFRSRVAQNLYLYVLWVALLGLFFNSVIRPQFGGVDYTWQGVWAQLLNIVSHPWYLYALGVYFVVAKVMARQRWKWVASGSAAALYLASGQVWLPLPANLCSGLVFFLIGAYWPELVRLMAYRLKAKRLVGLVAAYLAMALVVRALGISEISGVMLVLSMLAVPASVAIFAHFREEGSLTRGLRWIGRRTLPVYVMHFPLLVVVSLPVQGVPATAIPDDIANVFYLLLPLLATLIATCVALGLHAIAMRLPFGGWLFALPSWTKHAKPRKH